MTSAHLPTKNMASLRCSPLRSLLIRVLHRSCGTTWASTWSTSLNFSYHLHLIWILHDEFAIITSVCCTYTAGTLRASCSLRAHRNDFALRGYCRDLVVVFIRHVLLNWSQHWHVEVIVLIDTFHEVCWCRCTEFQFATNFVMAARSLRVMAASGHHAVVASLCAAASKAVVLRMVITPIFMMENCIWW